MVTSSSSPGSGSSPWSASSPALDELVSTLRAAGCVFAEDEAALLLDAACTPTDLAELVARRVAGLPLEQILGWAGFCGLRITLDAGVFVPRQRTEFLVQEAARLWRNGTRTSGVVVDLCCGSGALGLAVVTALSGAGQPGASPIELYATDIDPVAVRCARRNLAGLDAAVYEGDLYEALPDALWGRVDLLVANVPYVPTGAIELLPPEARTHEPRRALDGGPDGLDLQRRVTAEAAGWLAPGGGLLVETSDQQASNAVTTIRRHGLIARVARSDEYNATVVVATRPR
ncbi:MAG: putative protein N(5)-glutamine methyltransferase [Frankia sp.]